MNIKKLRLPMEALSNGGIIAKIRCTESFKYIEGKKTQEVDGNIKVEVMFPDSECETLAVKVPASTVSKAVLEAPPLTPLRFTGFEARLWTNQSGTTMITAKAVSVEVDDTIEY